MPYKISGTLSGAARIIIIKESDWSIESNTEESVGAYEVDELVSGAKLVLARKSDGEALGYGSVAPAEYTIPARGVFGGGGTGSKVDTMDYITISTLSDASDFGDLTLARQALGGLSNGSSDRGIFGGGNSATYCTDNVMDYITISSTGNATFFGYTLSTYGEDGGGCCQISSTSNLSNNRGIFAGGLDFNGAQVNLIQYITISSLCDGINFGDLLNDSNAIASFSNGTDDRGVFAGANTGDYKVNVIQYITISTTGNATDFGDLTSARDGAGGTSNTTLNRGIIAGGYTTENINIIEYITISSAGDSTDFGDLTVAKRIQGPTSDGANNRGVFAGGHISAHINLIDYITISSTSDATDFGDLTVARYLLGACSNAD